MTLANLNTAANSEKHRKLTDERQSLNDRLRSKKPTFIGLFRRADSITAMLSEPAFESRLSERLEKSEIAIDEILQPWGHGSARWASLVWVTRMALSDLESGARLHASVQERPENRRFLRL